MFLPALRGGNSNNALSHIDTVLLHFTANCGTVPEVISIRSKRIRASCPIFPWVMLLDNLTVL